ncbi:MAG: CPBP family intramembrane metalloprotease [Chloroflexi bacterium]|nr:CPBP family intramembrane metalloprotease [Chloroflexota bacterium]
MKNFSATLLSLIKSRINQKAAFVMVTFIILQFFFAPLISLRLSHKESDWIFSSYAVAFSALSYTTIVLGVLFLHANNFYDFFDRITLWAIAVGCFLRSLEVVGNTYGNLFAIYLLMLGASFAIYITTNKENIKGSTLKTFTIGVMWSIVTVITLALVAALISGKTQNMLPEGLGIILFRKALEQLSFVTIIEESLFRGLLVSILILNKHKEHTAFIIQAVLFWAIHYSQITLPFMFLIFLPLLTISTTIIAYRYRTVYPSILVHTLVNVFTTSLAIWFQTCFF